MRQVTFAKPQAPFGVGDKRLVPDDMAQRLEAEGIVSESEPFPPHGAPQKPVRAQPRPQRPQGSRDQRPAR